MNTKYFTIMLSVCLLAGCIKPVKFNPDLSAIPNDKATVFFYYKTNRQATVLDWSIPVIANGVNLDEVEYRGYIKKHMEPGTYKIHSQTANIDRQFDLFFRANKIYYVKIWKLYAGLGTTVNFMKTLKPDEI